MGRTTRFIIGGIIILGALSYLIYGGMRQALVYFITPSELKGQEKPSQDKFLRMGGMVVAGSLKKDLAFHTYQFEITDGAATVAVFFRGIPPDLFTEGKGAVVEGRMGEDGVFRATTIMAKHAEEYTPHKEGATSSARSFIPAKEEKKS